MSLLRRRKAQMMKSSSKAGRGPMDRFLTSGSAASSDESAPQRRGGGAPLRQKTLGQLAGVVDWRDEAATSAAPELQSIPPTLYLGHADVERLRDFLSDAIQREDEQASHALKTEHCKRQTPNSHLEQCLCTENNR